MKKTVRVFPDYCSSGLWEPRHPEGNGANMDESEVSHCVPAHIMIALKYWHYCWEWAANNEHITQWWKDKWEQDGITLVAAMNACQDEFDFIYEGDNF